MEYSERQIEQLNIDFEDVVAEYKERFFNISEVTFNEKRAKEFFLHGFSRRLNMMFHCFKRVFEIYPPNRTNVLGDDERSDLEAFIQTFTINLYGAIDNLAWIVNEEKKIGLLPLNVSLYNVKIRECFSKEFLDYIDNQDNNGFKKWYEEHCKCFRHSLGHRIPLYIPPAAVDDADRYQEITNERINAILNHDFVRVEVLEEEERELMHILPMYLHSFEEKSPCIYLHPQMIANFRTLLELYDKFLKCFVR